MDKEQALHKFWSGFGLTAYDENTVPDNAMSANNGKYLTYTAGLANFDEPVMLSASLWYKSEKDWSAITAKMYEINNHIGLGGKVVPFTGGALWIKRGVPFAQRMADEDDTIRRIYINIEVEYFTNT